jgi:AraC-like DNA-binding protein/quercetin dioxygenase-like cupin family protein
VAAHLRSPSISAYPDAVVVQAGAYPFAPGETVDNRRVRSRTLLWSLGGAGTITIGADTWDLTPGDVVLLPWQHGIRYQASDADPFRLAGVHVIPSYARSGPVVFRAAHGDDDPLADDPARSDPAHPTAPGSALRSRMERHEALRGLADYCLSAWRSRPPQEGMMRPLGVLLLAEMSAVTAGGPAPVAGASRFDRMRDFVQTHLASPGLSVPQVAAAAGVSTATAQRIARRVAGVSVARLVLETRLTRAAQLLHDSGLSVGQVARRVGIQDQADFARAFKRRYGLSPSAWAGGRRGP